MLLKVPGAGQPAADNEDRGIEYGDSAYLFINGKQRGGAMNFLFPFTPRLRF